RVPLAVLTLTALASFEAVAGLPVAAMQLSYARTSAARLAEVLDAPAPVVEPADPRPLPLASLRPPPSPSPACTTSPSPTCTTSPSPTCMKGPTIADSGDERPAHTRATRTVTPAPSQIASAAGSAGRAGPLHGVTVSLRDAQVRYEPGGPFAIDGVSLDLPPGTRIAVVGP